MSYQSHILKDIVQGRYGKKKYFDLVKRRSPAGAKLFVNKQYPVANSESEILESMLGTNWHGDAIDTDFETELEPENELDPVQYEIYTKKCKEQTRNPTSETIINRIDEDTNKIISDRIPQFAEQAGETADRESPQKSDGEQTERIEKIVRTTSTTIKDARRNSKIKLNRNTVEQKKRGNANRRRRKNATGETKKTAGSPEEMVQVDDHLETTNDSVAVQFPGEDSGTNTDELGKSAGNADSPGQDSGTNTDEPSGNADNVVVEQPEQWARLEALEKRMAEMEDYVVEMAVEIENLIAGREKIIRVINRLSSDIKITKNKIAR